MGADGIGQALPTTQFRIRGYGTFVVHLRLWYICGGNFKLLKYTSMQVLPEHKPQKKTMLLYDNMILHNMITVSII